MSEHALDAAYQRYLEGKIMRRDILRLIIDGIKVIERRLDALEVERSPADEVQRLLPSLLPLLPLQFSSFDRAPTAEEEAPLRRGPGRPRKEDSGTTYPGPS